MVLITPEDVLTLQGSTGVWNSMSVIVVTTKYQATGFHVCLITELAAADGPEQVADHVMLKLMA
jgi:hypothetical protein